MWSSLQEFVPAVLKRWWATVPGVALGLWSLVGLFRATPQLAAWVWLAVFGFGLMLATFLAFHQARTARDDAISRADQEELASFRLVGKPKWSVTDAFPYNLEAGRLETIPEPEHWKGNPEINFYLAADFQAMAHGGTNGGYLYDIRWSVLNLPAAVVATVPEIPENGIGLQPRQSVPFKPTLYLRVEQMTYSNLRSLLENSPIDPVLLASYGRKGSDQPDRSELVLSRHDVLAALSAFEPA